MIVVNAADVRAHAGHIRGLQREVGKAQSAAAQANFSSTMFGTIGSKIVWPLMAPLGALGEETMSMMDEILGSTADNVTKLADDFEVVDTAVRDGWDKVTDTVEDVTDGVVDVWGWIRSHV